MGAGIGTAVLPGWGTLIGGAGGAAYGGITGWLSASDDKKMTAYKIDPTHGAGAYQYGEQDFDYAGGELSGAEKRARHYDALGDAYENRTDAFADYAQADQDYARQQQARAQQMGLAQQYQDVIAGKEPSLAEMQMRAGQDRAAQSALNMAASARGGGGMLAAQQAQQAGALGQQNVNRDAAMMRAQETAQARDAYGNLMNNVRGADMSAMGQRADMAQAQAGIQLQSEQQRYNQAMGYRQGADGLRQDQRDANISIAQSNQSAATAVQTGQAQAAAAERASNRAAAAQAFSGGAQAFATMYTGGKKGG